MGVGLVLVGLVGLILAVVVIRVVVVLKKGLGVVLLLLGAGVASIMYTFFGMVANFEIEALSVGRFFLLRRSFFCAHFWLESDKDQCAGFSGLNSHGMVTRLNGQNVLTDLVSCGIRVFAFRTRWRMFVE